MRLTTFLLTLCIALQAAASEKEPPRILIVADASASMATSWSGQAGDRMGALRAAVDALAGSLKGRKSQPEIAIRVFGDQLRPDAPEPCTDSRLIRSWTRVDEGDLNRALDSIQPLGSGSLVHTLEKVLSDLGTPNPNDLVFIILDDLNRCGGDLDQAFAALTLEGKGAKVHVYGFGLDVTDQAEISRLATFHNVGWPQQLFQGISIVVSKILSLPLQQEPIALSLRNTENLGFEPKSLTVVGSWAKEPISVDLTRDKPLLKAGLGTASILISGTNDEEFQKIVRVPVNPEEILALDLYEPREIDLSIRIKDSGWNVPPRLEVTWSNVPEEPIRLVLTENGIPGASWFHAENILEPSGTASLPLPARAAEMVVQLRSPVGSAMAVIGEESFSWPGRAVKLQAPTEIDAGTSISVEWDTESYPGDLINLVPADSSSETIGVTCRATEGSPCDLLVPFERCPAEIRYIDGESFEILARHRLEIGGQTAGLLAPSSVPSADNLSVRWWGPVGPSDVITLTATDSAEDEYLDWASPSDGSPALLKAPQKPGEYEIRYLVEGSEIATARPLTIEEIEVRLEVPKKVRVGDRLTISWTGPNGPDDFLVLVRPGKNLNKQMDFAYVAVGSPLTMAAPDRPGPYEIQYISAHPRRTLATAKFKVEK